MPSAGEVASVVIVALIFATVMSRTTLETITSEVATVGSRSAATTIALGRTTTTTAVMRTAGKWSLSVPHREQHFVRSWLMIPRCCLRNRERDI